MKRLDEKELWFDKACITQMSEDDPDGLYSCELKEAITGCPCMGQLLGGKFFDIFQEELGDIWDDSMNSNNYRLLFVQFCLEKAGL